MCPTKQRRSCRSSSTSSEDRSALEEAQGLQRLIDEFGMTHKTAARAVGRSRSATSNLLRLLSLAEPAQAMPC